MEMGSLNSLYSSTCHGECSSEGPFTPPAAVPWGADSDEAHAHTSTVQTNYRAHTHTPPPPFGGVVNILHGTPLLNTAEKDA